MFWDGQTIQTFATSPILGESIDIGPGGSEACMNGERKSPYISSPKKSLNLLVLTGPGNSALESETQVGSAGCRGARRNRDVGRPDSKRGHLAACTPHSVDTPLGTMKKSWIKWVEICYIEIRRLSISIDRDRRRCKRRRTARQRFAPVLCSIRAVQRRGLAR